MKIRAVHLSVAITLASVAASGVAKATVIPAFLDRMVVGPELVAKKCPKGEVMQCQKISEEMKRLGWSECRCVTKGGRSGH